jgi:hypothetical protein
MWYMTASYCYEAAVTNGFLSHFDRFGLPRKPSPQWLMRNYRLATVSSTMRDATGLAASIKLGTTGSISRDRQETARSSTVGAISLANLQRKKRYSSFLRAGRLKEVMNPRAVWSRRRILQCQRRRPLLDAQCSGGTFGCYW